MPVRCYLNWLRPLMSDECWDYIIIWKLSNDHRCLVLMDCICAGTCNIEGITFSAAVSFAPPCRDVFFSHPRTKSCDLLDNVPSSMAMDSGAHAEAVVSNTSKWLNNRDLEEAILGTRVLVPLPLGLLELFVAENVPEDKELINFIKNQCIMFLDEQALSNSGSEYSGFPTYAFFSDPSLQEAIDVFQMQQVYDSVVGKSGFNEMKTSKCDTTSSISKQMEAPSLTLEDQISDQIPLAEESNKSDCSDPNNDDENEGKYRKRNGKGHQAKNLEAERKRRKKLNDKLYSLRALVPNISKLDRTAILGDAINYVKELQEQVKNLQVELEEHSDDESALMMLRNNADDSMPLVSVNQDGSNNWDPQPICETENTNERVNQLEEQVEVLQMDGNEFFVKLLFEHRPGAFVRLIEALASLGLQIINVNVTRLDCWVSNVFTVEKQENEAIQADHVRECLHDELARTLA